MTDDNGEYYLSKDPSKRSRSVDLWKKMAEALKSSKYASGGYVGEPKDQSSKYGMVHPPMVELIHHPCEVDERDPLWERRLTCMCIPEDIAYREVAYESVKKYLQAVGKKTSYMYMLAADANTRKALARSLDYIDEYYLVTGNGSPWSEISVTVLKESQPPYILKTFDEE